MLTKIELGNVNITSKELTEDYTISDDFDKRWDEQFGEPSTEIFTVSEFIDWLDEVINFE